MVGYGLYPVISMSGLKSFLIGMVILLLCHSSLYAQRARQDMVYLRNGEMVRGVILSRDAVKGISVENSCGIRWVSLAEIDTIIPANHKALRLSATKNFYNLSSLTLLFGEGEDGFVPLPSLTTTFGYRFTSRFMAGAGIGFEYFKWPVLPLYAEARYFLRSDDVLLPFVSIRSGGALPLDSSYEGTSFGGCTGAGKTHGGFMINPETGIWFPLSKTTGISLSIGYFHQRLSYDSMLYDWRFGNPIGTRRIYTHFNRINLRMGLFFN